ncbi:MAG TPA: hypothetical protein VN692_16830 [Steroidobacteraceae bacterium]|nr:hypothetical protein [Steroidobacteraceae bacterium]
MVAHNTLENLYTDHSARRFSDGMNRVEISPEMFTAKVLRVVTEEHARLLVAGA